MKQLVFFMCLLVSTLAAPAPASESTEVAVHANEALRWMELYRLYQQQGIVQNPFLPSAHASVDAAPPQSADVPPPAPIPVGDASEDETEDVNPATKTGSPAPLNSDEVEEAEEVEAAEADPAVVEAAEPSANPDVPVDAAPVDAATVDVPPVDVVPVDSALAAPGVAVDPAAPAKADILTAGDVPAEVDAGATDVGAAALAAETNMTDGAADPTAL
ncbi:enamelin [Archocentrus centrarchus]|uniref:enamelin n=1 Tax=Archocentrus centrarchus TaxID=63155 RepID=UPI0011E9FAEB|nr:uncharacterized protein LOC115790226 [Archocentrus centrarchus]